MFRMELQLTRAWYLPVTNTNAAMCSVKYYCLVTGASPRDAQRSNEFPDHASFDLVLSV